MCTFGTRPSLKAGFLFPRVILSLYNPSVWSTVLINDVVRRIFAHCLEHNIRQGNVKVLTDKRNDKEYILANKLEIGLSCRTFQFDRCAHNSIWLLSHCKGHVIRTKAMTNEYGDYFWCARYWVTGSTQSYQFLKKPL